MGKGIEATMGFREKGGTVWIRSGSGIAHGLPTDNQQEWLGNPERQRAARAVFRDVGDRWGSAPPSSIKSFALQVRRK